MTEIFAPWEPIFWHGLRAHHFPGVDDNNNVKSLTLLKNREQLRRVQVPIVNVASNLHTHKPKLLHTAAQLADRMIGRLHRERAQADELIGVLRARACNVVVEEARILERMIRLGPVGEENGDGAQDLRVHAGCGHVLGVREMPMAEMESGIENRIGLCTGIARLLGSGYVLGVRQCR